MSECTKEQAKPTPNSFPAVWDVVIADLEATPNFPNKDVLIRDMRERDAEGRKRYGTPLQPHNGRDAVIDAYQEALDMVVYLKQAVIEGRIDLAGAYGRALDFVVYLRHAVDGKPEDLTGIGHDSPVVRG